MPEVVSVPVYYDFASTVCYFTHRILGRLSEPLSRAAVDLVWSPIDLTSLVAWGRGDRFTEDRYRNLARLSDELKVPVGIPDHWMDSRPAMAVAISLRGSTQEASWREAVWSWVYEECRNLDESDAVRTIAASASLDVGESWREQLQTLDESTRAAKEAGVEGVPTFLLGVWPLGIGIHDDATMLAFLQRFAEKTRQLAKVN